jgi:hypothetical protein
MNPDKITTLAGGLAGGAMIAAGFGLINNEQAHAIGAGSALILAAIGVILEGYYTNKT